MASDVAELIDHLVLPETDLVAYSMGSYIGLRLLQTDRRIQNAVLAGIGADALDHSEPPKTNDEELDFEEASARLLRVTPHLAARIDSGVADPIALLDVLGAGFTTADKEFSRVTARVLLLSGTRDSDPEPLAAVLPHAAVLRLDADHASTMPHPEFVPSILRFLAAEH